MEAAAFLAESGRARSTRRLRVPLPEWAGGLGGRVEAAILAPDILGRLEREVSKHRDTALDPAHPEALHRMRLAFKKYRYVAEVLLPLFPKATEETSMRLHAFQSLMGTIHDFDVILAEAHAFRSDILGVPTESTIETAFRRLREAKSREFREIAGGPDPLATVFGEELRP